MTSSGNDAGCGLPDEDFDIHAEIIRMRALHHSATMVADFGEFES